MRGILDHLHGLFAKDHKKYFSLQISNLFDIMHFDLLAFMLPRCKFYEGLKEKRA